MKKIEFSLHLKSAFKKCSYFQIIWSARINFKKLKNIKNFTG